MPASNVEVPASLAIDVNKRDDAEFELVDIKDFNLPLLDEPMPLDEILVFHPLPASQLRQVSTLRSGGSNCGCSGQPAAR
jgi:hypothetical protein